MVPLDLSVLLLEVRGLHGDETVRRLRIGAARPGPLLVLLLQCRCLLVLLLQCQRQRLSRAFHRRLLLPRDLRTAHHERR